MFTAFSEPKNATPQQQNQVSLMIRRMAYAGALDAEKLEAKAVSLGRPQEDISMSDLIDMYEFEPTSEVIDVFVDKEKALREIAISYMEKYQSPDNVPDDERDTIIDNSTSGMLLHHIISEAASGHSTILVSDAERTRLESLLTPNECSVTSD